MKTYSATSLEDIAKHFDLRANLVQQRADRTNGVREAAKYTAEARTWREAAAMLRDTELKPA